LFFQAEDVGAVDVPVGQGHQYREA
jgi:hypothetical protein